MQENKPNSSKTCREIMIIKDSNIQMHKYPHHFIKRSRIIYLYRKISKLSAPSFISSCFSYIFIMTPWNFWVKRPMYDSRKNRNISLAWFHDTFTWGSVIWFSISVLIQGGTNQQSHSCSRSELKASTLYSTL